MSSFRNLISKLTFWIFVALFLGVLVGIFFPKQAIHFQILSDIFLKLIKMLIAPLVLSTLITGIAKIGDIKSVGRLGFRTLTYFYIATFVSLSLGLFLAEYFKPGYAIQIALPTKDALTGVVANTGIDFKSFISRVFPTSIAGAMANNEILPIVIFSIFFGISLSLVKEKGKPVTDFMESLSEIMFKMTTLVMFFAPFGIFGAISAAIAKEGIGILRAYMYLIGSFYLGLFLFGGVILALVCYFFKINYFKLIIALKEPLLLAFGTASSESAFPQTMDALKKWGCDKKVIGFVLPLGYSFNLDAAMMNMTFATLFIAQCYRIDLSFSQEITMVVMLLLASKGVAGVPRASLVVVAGLLSSFNIPQEGLLLLLGIDHVLDMGRSAVNLLGNAVATCVIDKLENGNLQTQQS